MICDVDVRRAAIQDPARPAERQRRALDAPPQQPLTEIVVKTSQLGEVDSVLIDPHALDDEVQTGGAMAGKQALVHQREPIIRPRINAGCAGVKVCAHPARPIHQMRVAEPICRPARRGITRVAVECREAVCLGQPLTNDIGRLEYGVATGLFERLNGP